MISSGNLNYNSIIEIIHLVLVNLVWTYNIIDNYADEDDPWMGILSNTSFPLHSTQNIIKGCTPVQLVFGCDMIILIKHNFYW